MPRSLFVAAAFIGFLVAPAARAQLFVKTAYSAVDEVSVTSNSMVVTGVVLGQSAPSTLEFFVDTYESSGQAMLQNCLKLATLTMAKPGAFLFTLTFFEGGGYPTCTLSRAKL